MNKWSCAATSLIAAIPAGYMSYLMVSVFMKRAESLETPFQVWAGAMLAVSALVTVMPFGILIFGGKSKKVKPEGAGDEGPDKTDAAVAAGAAAAAAGAAVADDAAEELEAAEESEGGEFEDELGAAEDDEGEFVDGFGEEMELEEIDEDDIFAEGDDAEFEEFDVDDFEDEEDK